MQNQFSDPTEPTGASPPPKRKSSMGLVIILAISMGLVLVLLCCGGGIGIVWFGLGVVEDSVLSQLHDHPAVQEHIGEVEDFEMNLMASANHEDSDTFIYDVSGSNGSGRLEVRSVTVGSREEISNATLELPDGTRINLVPGE